MNGKTLRTKTVNITTGAKLHKKVHETTQLNQNDTRLVNGKQEIRQTADIIYLNNDDNIQVKLRLLGGCYSEKHN